jgi:hypothetical protein
MISRDQSPGSTRQSYWFSAGGRIPRDRGIVSSQSRVRPPEPAVGSVNHERRCLDPGRCLPGVVVTHRPGSRAAPVDPSRRGDLGAGLLGAGCRLGSRFAHHPRGARWRRLDADERVELHPIASVGLSPVAVVVPALVSAGGEAGRVYREVSLDPGERQGRQAIAFGRGSGPRPRRSSATGYPPRSRVVTCVKDVRGLVGDGEVTR